MDNWWFPIFIKEGASSTFSSNTSPQRIDKEVENLEELRNGWKSICLQWKRDYKILRFAVNFYEKYYETMCIEDFTEYERKFYDWCKFMEYQLDIVTEIEKAYRDYIDEKEGLYKE